VTTHAARLADLDARLAETTAAISKIVATGQAYSAEGRMMTRANLRDLRELEVSLRRERSGVARRGRIRTFGVVVR